MKKISRLLILSSLFFVTFGFSQTATAPSSGDGTSGNPYQISSLNNLYWIAVSDTAWGKYYVQTADINASETSTWPGGGWTPIGNSTTNFSGSYDGQSHTISGLTVNRNDAFQGLIGYTSTTSVIQNLSVINVSITNLFGEIGGLAGVNRGAISNCYTSGSVYGYYDAGGLVGLQSLGSITESYSSVNTSGNDATGGFVGRIIGGTISDCYSTGTVAGNAKAGGLTGEGGGGSVANCYSVGAVSGSSFVGGLIGTNSSAVSNSFWDTQTSGQATSAGGTGKTTTEMKTQSTFTDSGWSTSTWYMDAGTNGGYPYLSWQNPGGSPLPVELTSFTAITKQQNVELAWKTATEKNNYGFEIQKSVVSSQSSEKSWSKIGFVEGNGTTNSPKSYSFIDVTASGKTAYRLKQIDRDGKFSYSQTVEVTINNTPKEFSLGQNYPNPFNPTTVISYQLPMNSFVSLKVYDVVGREVATLVNEVKEAGNYTFQLSMNNYQLSSGVYFYSMTAGKFSAVKKLTLMK